MSKIWMSKIWFALLGLLSAILVSPGPGPAAAPNQLLAEAQTILAPTKDDRILGNPNAPITIVEYASLTCPHCAHFENDVLPELKKKWIDTGKAKLILRDYPLDEPALRAAMIARCAPPDRFYAYIDTFFGSQEKWVKPDYREPLARLVKLGGMSREEFDNCLKNTALENKIVEERLVASKELDVNSTPTFFINGTKFTGAPTVEEFDKALSGLSAKS
jgi:protein-disulfide isomerase